MTAWKVFLVGGINITGNENEAEAGKVEEERRRTSKGKADTHSSRSKKPGGPPRFFFLVRRGRRHVRKAGKMIQ
jgi:hypothetical protein